MPLTMTVQVSGGVLFMADAPFQVDSWSTLGLPSPAPWIDLDRGELPPSHGRGRNLDFEG